MKVRIALTVLLTLAACGVDGPPERPSDPPGYTVSGEVSVGLRADGL